MTPGLRLRPPAPACQFIAAIKPFLRTEQLEHRPGNLAVSHPLTGLRAASYYGCHTRKPADIQGHESSHYPRSLEDILRVLGAEIVDYPIRDNCCGYHLAWPNTNLSKKMTGEVLEGAQKQGVDPMVTSSPRCFKNLDGIQPKALAATGRDFHLHLPVLYLPKLVDLACGMSAQEMMLDWHAVPVSVRL